MYKGHDNVDVQWTTDTAYIEAVARRGDVLPWIVDDEGERRAEQGPLAPPGARFLEVRVAGQRCGYFVFEEKAPKVYVGHACLTGDCRGRMAVVAGKKALDVLWKEGALRVLGFIPGTPLHRRVLMYAGALGGRLLGWQRRAWKRHGKVFDMNVIEFGRCV